MQFTTAEPSRTTGNSGDHQSSVRSLNMAR